MGMRSENNKWARILLSPVYWWEFRPALRKAHSEELQCYTENRKRKLEKRKAPAADGAPTKEQKSTGGNACATKRGKSRFLIPFKRRTGFGMTRFGDFSER